MTIPTEQTNQNIKKMKTTSIFKRRGMQIILLSGFVISLLLCAKNRDLPLTSNFHTSGLLLPAGFTAIVVA